MSISIKQYQREYQTAFWGERAKVGHLVGRKAAEAIEFFFEVDAITYLRFLYPSSINAQK